MNVLVFKLNVIFIHLIVVEKLLVVQQWFFICVIDTISISFHVYIALRHLLIN